MAITIKGIKTNNVDSNSYIITGQDQKTIIIDPGEVGAGSIIQYHKDHNLYPDYVILTHEHYDHIAGLPALSQLYDFRVIGSKNCARHVGNPKRNLSAYMGASLENVNLDIYCEDCKNILNWNSMILKFIHTPGHSPGSICISGEGAFFTGDTILNNLKTVTKLPLGSIEELKNSIDAVLLMIGDIQTIYPGHGDCFSINELDYDIVLGNAQAHAIIQETRDE